MKKMKKIQLFEYAQKYLEMHPDEPIMPPISQLDLMGAYLGGDTPESQEEYLTWHSAQLAVNWWNRSWHKNPEGEVPNMSWTPFWEKLVDLGK